MTAKAKRSVRRNPDIPKIVDAVHSEEQDIPCSTCKRMVKRAVGLSDRNGWHGLDCAAKILGHHRTRRAMDDIWFDGRCAVAKSAGSQAGVAALERYGSLKGRSWAEKGALRSRADVAAMCPYLPNTFEWHEFQDAMQGTWLV